MSKRQFTIATDGDGGDRRTSSYAAWMMIVCMILVLILGLIMVNVDMEGTFEKSGGWRNATNADQP